MNWLPPATSTQQERSAPPGPRQPEPSLVNCFLGLWRLTWYRRMNPRNRLVLAGGLLVLPLLIYFSVSPDLPAPFWYWCLDFYLFLILPLFCLVQFGGMIRDDLQSETLVFLLTRPVSRARFYLVQYFSLVVWIECIVLIQAVLIGLAGWVRDVPEVLTGMGWVLGIQSLAVVGWGAVSALVGLLAKRYIVLGLMYGVVVEIGLGRVPTNINNLSLSRHFEGLLAHHAFFAEQFKWTYETWGSGLAWIGGLTLVLLLLGSAIFTLREFHAGEQMKK